MFQIGVDTGTFEALGQELGDLAQLYQDSAELRQTLVNPVFKPAEKRAMKSCSCEIFFSRCTLSDSTRERICVLAMTMSS